MLSKTLLQVVCIIVLVETSIAQFVILNVTADSTHGYVGLYLCQWKASAHDISSCRKRRGEIFHQSSFTMKSRFKFSKGKKVKYMELSSVGADSDPIPLNQYSSEVVIFDSLLEIMMATELESNSNSSSLLVDIAEIALMMDDTFNLPDFLLPPLIRAGGDYANSLLAINCMNQVSRVLFDLLLCCELLLMFRSFSFVVSLSRAVQLFLCLLALRVRAPPILDAAPALLWGISPVPDYISPSPPTPTPIPISFSNPFSVNDCSRKILTPTDRVDL